jgi:hypothetical protein
MHLTEQQRQDAIDACDRILKSAGRAQRLFAEAAEGFKRLSEQFGGEHSARVLKNDEQARGE